jgi:hypothetical protein
MFAFGVLTALTAITLLVLREPSGSVSHSDATRAAQGDDPGFIDPGQDDVTRFAMVAGTNPRSAVNAALALGDPADRLAALHEALPVFLSERPNQALKWVRDELPGLAPDMGIAVLRELADFDPRLAHELAGNVDDPARPTASREVLVAWAATDPVASSQGYLNDPAADGVTAVEISRLWTHQDPASAFAFAAALPSPDPRQEALAAVFETWAVSDPAQATQALAILPHAPSRVPLVDRVALQWAKRDPEAALAWARALPNAEESLAATTTVLGATAASVPGKIRKP